MVARIKRQKATEEDQILSELQYIKARINQSSRILTDKERTAFFFVVVPEQMIILDTQKATQLFSKFDVPIAGYVVNRVLPAELAGQQIPPYLQNRLQSQNHYLERSEEHTSELQSRSDLVCRLLLEQNKQNIAARSSI